MLKIFEDNLTIMDGLEKIIERLKLIDNDLVYVDNSILNQCQNYDVVYIDVYDSQKELDGTYSKLRRNHILIEHVFLLDTSFKDAIRFIMNASHPDHARFNTEKGYEVTTKGDKRFSPFCMIAKLDDKNITIEDYYQLWIKNYGYFGAQSWKDCKGKCPIELIAVDSFTRLSVERDKDYLYLFTDNVLRNSGRNSVDKSSSYYNRFQIFHKGNCHYPYRTQACIRGLQNACPISTMYDGRKHQLMGNMSLDSMRTIWLGEYLYIKQLLLSGNYKGIKFSNHIFGQGQYSSLSDEYQVELDKILASMGIHNGITAAEPIKHKSLEQLYLDYLIDNPSLFYELAALSTEFVFTDMFGTTQTSQANQYCKILNSILNGKYENLIH